MRYTLTGTHRDELSSATNRDNPQQRIEALTDIILEIAEDNDIENINEFAKHIAIHEIVGTGMTMGLGEVFQHLADLTELHSQLDIPSHGGSQDLLDELTIGDRLDHNAYFALQTLYGDLICEELSNRQTSEQDNE